MKAYFASREAARKAIASAAGHGDTKAKKALIAKAHRQYPPQI